MRRLSILIFTFFVIGSCAFSLSAESTRKERRAISEGNKLYKEGKYKEASQQYQLAIAVNPQSPEARFSLALTKL